MALNKPILSNIKPFDKSDGVMFNYTVASGGDAISGSRLTILINGTQTQAYQGDSILTNNTFDLPPNAGTLSNGGYYSAYIQTKNAIGEYSEKSNAIQFYCFSTPVFKFNNLISGQTIDKQSYTFNVDYTQAEGEELNSYIFNLYNANGTQILDTSGKIFGSNPSYTFSGLSDGSDYRVQCLGETVNKVLTNTPKVYFAVRYIIPPGGDIIQTINDCENGYVRILVNLTTVTNPELYQYIRIKRRIKGSYKWLQLFEVLRATIINTTLFLDRYNKSNVEYEYSCVLVDYNGVESPDNISLVRSVFDACFLVDASQSFKVKENVSYDNTKSVQKNGIHEPIGTQFPSVVYNSKTNYKSGGITFQVMQDGWDIAKQGMNFNNQPNPNLILDKANIINDFIKNKKPKIWKDWNGNIRLINCVDDTDFAYDMGVGMATFNMHFNWVEVGFADNYNDLLNAGMIKTQKPYSLTINALDGAVVTLEKNGLTVGGTVINDNKITFLLYDVGLWAGVVTYNGQAQPIEVLIDGTQQFTEYSIKISKLTVSGGSDIYAEKPIFILQNTSQGGIVSIDGIADKPSEFNIIQFGDWSGFATGFNNQKQPLSVIVESEVNQTLTIKSPATINMIALPEINYYITNSSNIVSNRGDKVLKLFTDGNWVGSAKVGEAETLQTQNISMLNVQHGSVATYTVSSTVLNLSGTSPYKMFLRVDPVGGSQPAYMGEIKSDNLLKGSSVIAPVSDLIHTVKETDENFRRFNILTYPDANNKYYIGSVFNPRSAAWQTFSRDWDDSLGYYAGGLTFNGYGYSYFFKANQDAGYPTPGNYTGSDISIFSNWENISYNGDGYIRAIIDSLTMSKGSLKYYMAALHAPDEAIYGNVVGIKSAPQNTPTLLYMQSVSGMDEYATSMNVVGESPMITGDKGGIHYTNSTPTTLNTWGRVQVTGTLFDQNPQGYLRGVKRLRYKNDELYYIAYGGNEYDDESPGAVWVSKVFDAPYWTRINVGGSKSIKNIQPILGSDGTTYLVADTGAYYNPETDKWVGDTYFQTTFNNQMLIASDIDATRGLLTMTCIEKGSKQPYVFPTYTFITKNSTKIIIIQPGSYEIKGNVSGQPYSKILTNPVVSGEQKTIDVDVEYVDVAESWDIGVDTPTDVVATLYSNGRFEVVGEGKTNVNGSPPWAAQASKIKTIFISSGVTEDNMKNWFKNTSIKSYSPNNNFTPIKNAESMFEGCANLIDVKNNFESLTNATKMFKGCTKIISAPFINNDTPNSLVADFAFDGCTSLTGRSGSITDGFISIDGMYKNCPKLNDSILIIGTPTNYNNIFDGSALSPNICTLDYITASEHIVDYIIANKTVGSNIVKGVNISDVS